jgi:hypothetical protein
MTWIRIGDWILFALLITTTNYNKSSAVITAWVTLRANLIFALQKLVFLPTSRLPWSMPESLASIGFYSTSPRAGTLYLNLVEN